MPTKNRPSQPREGNRTELAAARVRELIVSGALAPGQRLSERLVGEQLNGLSRTPLREAFKILAIEGLVTIEPNRGALVTALGVDEISAAFDVLIGLEAMAAEPACMHITDAELGAIRELHASMVQAYERSERMQYFQINQAIHQHIVDAARNPVLSRIYAAECARIRRYRYAGNMQRERWTSAVREHMQIVQALEDRAGLVLRELLREHHSRGWRVSREVLAQSVQVGAAAAPRARRKAGG
ncbi:MAG: GntR family transcriptional regulator [Ramlibacter sp.]|nr:GntR family transcriptional regulator [Ramlibacter sp.]